jgi:hypothetical protein
MNLDAAQKAKIAGWLEEGLKIADLQKRINDELGLNLTYMQVRFLVDDLKLVPKDPAPVKTSDSPLMAPAGAPPSQAPPAAVPEPPPEAAPGLAAPGGAAAGKVAVTLDEITRPGAIVSGKVTFSDGQVADWYLDQTGRLGLTPKQEGYRPAPGDVQQFQMQLQNELARLGF